MKLLLRTTSLFLITVTLFSLYSCKRKEVEPEEPFDDADIVWGGSSGLNASPDASYTIYEFNGENFSNGVKPVITSYFRSSCYKDSTMSWNDTFNLVIQIPEISQDSFLLGINHRHEGFGERDESTFFGIYSAYDSTGAPYANSQNPSGFEVVLTSYSDSTMYSSFNVVQARQTKVPFISSSAQWEIKTMNFIDLAAELDCELQSKNGEVFNLRMDAKWSYIHCSE